MKYLEREGERVTERMGDENPFDDVDVGDTGVATAALRPAGRVLIGDQLIDATSTGRWIDKGKKVRVVAVGLTVEVEEIRS